MRRIFTLLFVSLFVSFSAQAQLPSGSVAPNFTVTDIDGNTWTLYDILDQGKTVYIDVMATWCGPCLSYKNTGAFENLWAQYGPDGTDEIFAFMIEADPSTPLSDLYGPSSSSIADWTVDVDFPIVNDDDFNDLYAINYFPTVYMVCPNRILTEVGQVNTAGLYSAKGDCRVAIDGTNGALLSFADENSSFCGGEPYEPVVNFQNMGTEPITSATFELFSNGILVGEEEWTGTLNTYQFAEVSFPGLTVTETLDLVVNVASVNGAADADADDNTIETQVALAPGTATNLVTLTITTDNFGFETYWEVVNSQGNALYSGGNPGIFSVQISLGTYESATTYVHELALPVDDCYEFRIYDFYGDGICCDYGNGSYSVEDADGNLLLSGGEFEDLASHPFELSGGTAIENNARIALYIGDEGEFCQVLPYAPQFTVQNVGANTITSMIIDMAVNGVVEQTIQWDGTLAPEQTAIVGAEEVLLDEDSDVTFSIVSINGVADNYDYYNELSVSLDRTPVTAEEQVIFELTTDNYGYETYWEIVDDAGNVLASGGNELVAGTEGGEGAANGGGDPGAYGNNETIFEELTLPVEGCFELRVLDDYGDGMCCQYGNGYYRLVDYLGNVIVEGGSFGSADLRAFEYEMTVSADELTELTELTLFPNPARDEVTLNFSLAESMPLRISLYNTLGQEVRTVAAGNFVDGQHNQRVDIHDLTSGMYFVRIESAGKLLSRKFVVNN